jgi:hypothetical protein
MNLAESLPCRLAALVLCFFFVGCSGSRSTVAQGFAYRMKREAAAGIVRDAVAASLPSEKITATSDLTVSGSIRMSIDKHTFNASAVPASAGAWGFEVSHFGTLPVKGAKYSRKIYESILQRADALGQRVSVK